ncbi:bacillithiol system redox-active protein YtxJ [Savagea sp. SN6]|uniref:Bacillithiol system redox-active protein YtxJ n=2 Tax=Savagea serpentis TaxID=2785297 RepID=A0A8J7GEE8_9BACL|nr:bacillithiol system redox-active protein YtxJ [Savagea serpentis]
MEINTYKQVIDMSAIMKQIKSIPAWREILEQSKQSPQIIFKFSATCVVSPPAHKQMSAFMKKSDVPVHLVIVQTDRAVSDAIEADLGVRHESPQVLILSGGRAVWQATHYKIKERDIRKAIKLYA